MRRRDFGRTSIAAIGATIFANSAKGEKSPATGDFPRAPGLTSYAGNFVSRTKYEDIPANVIELGKKSILDGLGLALAGSRAESGPISRKFVEQSGACVGKSTIIGTSQKTSARFAALVNGISIHADDFDDTQLAAAKDRVYGLLMHPTVPVLPAIFALAEQRAINGKEWMLAYHLGVEVECKIAEAIAPRHYEDGFHTTGTCGPFGSAAACAKILNFDLSKTLKTFGLAASNSGGLRENFGTMTKPYRFLEAISLRLPHPSGHDGTGAADSGEQYRSVPSGKSGRGRQSQHDHNASPSRSQDRASSQIQHGILHGDSTARAQGRARSVFR